MLVSANLPPVVRAGVPTTVVPSQRAAARRMPLLVLACLLVLMAAPAAEAGHPPGTAAEGPFRLATDRAAPAGLDFVHAGHLVDRYQRFEETTMGGACWGDYDDDGDVDLFVPDSLGPDGEGRSRLYRNDGDAAASGARFTDVTATAVPHRPGMAQGCVWGDYDADGHLDLFVTYAVADYSLQRSVLFRNVDGERFEDVTARVGITGDATDPDSPEACISQHEDDQGRLHGRCFTVGAAWIDHDLDGDLDLYLTNYVNHPEGSCGDARSPNPILCTGQPNRFYRNNADGTFTEIGAQAAAAVNGEPTHGRSLGVVATDIDGDGWPDLYVANDYDANALFINLRNGRFFQSAFDANAAGIGPRINKGVHQRAGMGVDATDLDNDGHVDLLSTHLGMQYDAVLLARHNGTDLYWEEVAGNSSGVEAMARTVSRWGGGFTDFDLDGRKDIFAVSGHQYREIPGPVTLLLHRDHDFVVQGAPVWPWGNDTRENHGNYRGAAVADYDDDGDPDVFVTGLESLDGPGVSRLLTFHTADTHGLGAHPDNPGRGHHWLRVTLTGTQSATEAIGARVAVALDNGTTIHEWRRSGGSYLNDNDPRLLFGIGNETRGNVTVTWPGGAVDGPHAFDLGTRPGLAMHLVEPDNIPPRPTAWTREPRAVPGGIELAWQGSYLSDLAYYKVYLGEGRPPIVDPLASARTFEFHDRATHQATIPVASDGEVWVRIALVDVGGRESEATTAVRLMATGPAESAPSVAPLLTVMMLVAVLLLGRHRHS